MMLPPNERPTPRKQPRQARAAQKVAYILEAAARILETEGHAAFSTNAVARLAGISIGTLYQYFPNKDAILGALLARETAQLLADAQVALDRPDEDEALSGLIAAAIGHQFRRPRLARLLDFEEARLPHDAHTEHVVGSIATMTARLLERLDLPSGADSHIATRDVIAIIRGMVDAAGAYGETDLEDLARRVGRAVFGYLSLTPPPD